jgi:tripartite-type tricarboxylate transporter receptor subunit TctC
VEAGKLKALAVTSMEHVSSLPGVEPIAKTVPGMHVETWYALAAPGTISEAVANKISSDVAEILKVPSVAERFQTLSLVTIGNAPKAAAAFVDEDAKRWQGVIERIGLKPE